MAKVVKLAQPGYDVKTAGDENLIYNSNWPLLKIYKQGDFTTTDNATATQLVVDHDLGYVPAFWFFSNNTLASQSGTVDDRSDFNDMTQNVQLSINSKRLVFDIAPGFLIGTIKLYYYIFILDITKDYTAPTIKTGAVAGSRLFSKVFKLSKPGKDTSSSRLEDYVVHSAARSPLIHAVKNFTLGTAKVSFDHNLGYAPMFFAYLKTVDAYVLLSTGGGVSGFTVDANTITFDPTFYGGNEALSLVVLKDPFTLDYTVNVTV